MKSGNDCFIGGLQLTVNQVQLEAINIMPEKISITQAIVNTIDALDRVDDARILVGIALEQYKVYPERNSEIHKLILCLEAAKGILETEIESAQVNAKRIQSQVFNKS